ncbi:MAG: hypothetical protein ACC658_05750 [Acidimicrobiia bacterium]
METHENDPTTERPDDPWDRVTDDFGGLGNQLKDTYRKVTKDRGPSDDEIKQAFSTLAGAWDQVAESVSTVLTDPDIRDQLKEAASSFATALGATITELGSELKRATTWAASQGDEEE